jgi:hypothetical protein
MANQVKVRCQAVAVRFVADTRTDEFLNIGVVLFSPVGQYAGAKFLSSWARISNAFPMSDLVHLRRLKRLFEKACEEWVARTQRPELFGAISEPISGVTANPEATLAELFHMYVGKDDDEGIVEGRDDETVWREFVKLTTPEVVHALTRHTLRSSHYEQVFERSWKNGAWNAAQPLSFDMRDPQSIREKALLWSSKIRELRPAENDTTVHFLVGLPHDNRPKEVRKAAQDAFDILSDTIKQDDGRVLPESKAGDLVKKIEEDLGHAAE